MRQREPEGTAEVQVGGRLPRLRRLGRIPRRPGPPGVRQTTALRPTSDRIDADHPCGSARPPSIAGRLLVPSAPAHGRPLRKVPAARADLRWHRLGGVPGEVPRRRGLREDRRDQADPARVLRRQALRRRLHRLGQEGGHAGARQRGPGVRPRPARGALLPGHGARRWARPRARPAPDRGRGQPHAPRSRPLDRRRGRQGARPRPPPPRLRPPAARHRPRWGDPDQRPHLSGGRDQVDRFRLRARAPAPAGAAARADRARPAVPRPGASRPHGGPRRAGRRLRRRRHPVPPALRLAAGRRPDSARARRPTRDRRGAGEDAGHGPRRSLRLGGRALRAAHRADLRERLEAEPSGLGRPADPAAGHRGAGDERGAPRGALSRRRPRRRGHVRRHDGDRGRGAARAVRRRRRQRQR